MSAPSTTPVYNHRPMQPSSVRTNPAPGAPLQPSFSLLDSLNTIKNEYEALRVEIVAMQNQRDELETKLVSQVAELNSVRKSLYELETAHALIRQQYEDEINRLRAELMAVQSQASGLPLSIRTARDPPLSEPPSSLPSASDPQTRPPLREERPHSSLGRDSRGERRRTVRDDGDSDRDPERLSDHRDPKRHKARRDHSGSAAYPPPMGTHPYPASGSAPKPSGSSFTSNNSLGLYKPGDAQPSGSTSLPPINLAPPQGEEIMQLTLQNVPPEFKKEGIDWHVLYNPKVKKTLDVSLGHTFNHSTVVCCVQFSADGRYLATGCNRTAQIYDVQTGAKVCILEDTTAAESGDLYIRSVRFSPDGKLLATGAEDHKIRIWDIAQRRVRQVLEGHQQEIYSLDFSRDGRFVVSGSGDKTMRIWNLYDHSRRTITVSDLDSLNNDCGVTSVAIAPDGSMVAAGSLDTLVRIWDVASGALLDCLRGHEDSVYSVAFTPDGRGVVSGSLDKTIKYWDVSAAAAMARGGKLSPAVDPRGRERPANLTPPSMSFVGHKDFVLSVSVSDDGRWVVSGSKDRCVHFWDSRTATLQFMLQGHKNSVISLDINPLGGMLATGSGDNTARIWTYADI